MSKKRLIVTSDIGSRKLEAQNKVLRLESDSGTESLISFSFIHFSEKDYGLRDCTIKDLVSLIRKLKVLGTKTWTEISRSGKHELGCEILKTCELRKPLPSSVPANIDKVMCFRYKEKAPMIGFREGSVFHIVFLDRDFTLYQH